MYLYTRNMTTQVPTIPPKRTYLSPSCLRSVSRITILDMPNVDAMSNIFFWIPLRFSR